MQEDWLDKQATHVVAQAIGEETPRLWDMWKGILLPIWLIRGMLSDERRLKLRINNEGTNYADYSDQV